MTILNPPKPGDTRNVINYKDYLRELKPKKRVKQPELYACVALHKRLQMLCAMGKLKGFYTHFPAGGGGKARGQKLKAMGLMPGVADYVFFAFGTVFFLEMKAEDGVQGGNQKTFQKLAEAEGYKYAVCWSLDEALETLKGWGVLV